MRIFIGLVLIILLSIKIRADDDDDFGTTLIHPSEIEYLQSLKLLHTPAVLSTGIPNAAAFQPFFLRLSENFMETCKTIENAQFSVSAVQPSEIVQRFNKIIAGFDRTYHGHPSRETVKQDVMIMRNQLNQYADEMAEFAMAQFIDEMKAETWTMGHINDFRGVEVGKNLADYLKHVNGLIGSIQKSIGRSRVKIQHAQLKRLGTKISNSVKKFENLVNEANDINLLSSSIAQIRNSLDGLRNCNNGKCFNDMKINARKIVHDLNQLKLLMEKQWTDMDSIFGTKKLPEELPSVNLAN